MLIFYAGEDQVTKTVAKRLVTYCNNSVDEMTFEDVIPRDYGTKALENIDKLVRLGEENPTVGVFDSDGECVLAFLQSHTTNGWKQKKCAINVAIDEAESWLIADRMGFAKYFQIDVSLIPPLDPKHQEISYIFPYKTSLFILQNLIPYSQCKQYKDDLRCVGRNKKPPRYNAIFSEFIEKYWNIDNAISNSKSLERAINRIRSIFTD